MNASSRVPIISVMMPAYNAEAYIGQAIESVLAQACPDWELIVVNDGSTDGTRAVAAGYADPRISICEQPNSGEGAARNTALAHMQGRYIAFLDADDVYLPDHLGVLAGYLDSHPECGGVYTDGYHCDENGTRMMPLSARRRGPFQGHLFEQVALASDVFGPPLCVGLRREVVTRNNLQFDPGIVIGPDWDFLTRYSAVADFGYVDQRTCLYRIHRTNISVRTGVQKRRLSLARCREKVIDLPDFESCSAETRTAIFYDLLINLLAGLPERQAGAARSPQFARLPAAAQARLLRLLAGQAIREGDQNPYVRDWLRAARSLHPADLRTALLSSLYTANPRLCRRLLNLRAARQPQSYADVPFHDIK